MENLYASLQPRRLFDGVRSSPQRFDCVLSIAVWFGVPSHLQGTNGRNGELWAKTGDICSDYEVESNCSLSSSRASSYHRGTRDGGAGSGSVSGCRGALGSGGRPTVLWFCSHSQRACSEKRTLPTKARCGTCFLARYSGVVNQCLGSPVASITSWAVT